MITLAASDVRSSGGILAALADKSCECFQRVLKGLVKAPPDAVVRPLERIIVHTNPHLDEYFAELLFRACLPREKWQCSFNEQSIFSTSNDLSSMHLWATAATIGLPVGVAGGMTPLFFFDEHVSGQTKIAASVSQIVADEMLTSVPPALATMLVEVNAIDEFGKGHPQNLNNLIKMMHEVQFGFGKDASGIADIRDTLTPEWKRSIVDACLAAVLVCLEDGVDLVSDPAAKKLSLSSSLDNYIQHSPHASHPRFADVVQRIKGDFGNQPVVFQEAVLQNRQGAILDSAGRSIPQLLLLARVCFACEYCWGPKLRDVIATHFWEQEFQKQFNFRAVQEAIEPLFAQQRPNAKVVTAAGVFTRTVLPEIEIEVQTKGPKPQKRRKRCPIWVVSATAAPGVFKPNQAITNYINRYNDGCGLILVHDNVLSTSALFKGSGIPDHLWRCLVEMIVSKEGRTVEPGLGKMEECGCWHIAEDSSGGLPPFILNGTKAHQYVPRSGLNAPVLCELVKRIFY